MKLELTVAHHTDEEFYNLGEIVHETTPEKLFAALPTGDPHDCQTAPMCFIIDLIEDDSSSCIDDREVDEETAEDLLGRPLGAAIAAAQAELTRIYQAMGSSKRLPVEEGAL